VWSAWKV